MCIPVDNIELVQVLKREEQFSTVEARPLLIEPLFTLQVVEELSSVDESASGVSKA